MAQKAVHFAEIDQEQFEKFFEAMPESADQLPMVKYWRFTVQAALSAGWLNNEFTGAKPEDVLHWKPGEVRRVAEAVMAKSQELSTVPKN